MNLPGYSTTNIIVGGRAATEELWKVYQCQYFLDQLGTKNHTSVSPEIMAKVDKSMRGQCQSLCNQGYAGLNCQPIHKRIGELLGYTDQQVDDFLKSMGGYNHMPDVDYPFELPPSLANTPRGKGFESNESKNHFVRSKATSFI